MLDETKKWLQLAYYITVKSYFIKSIITEYKSKSPSKHTNVTEFKGVNDWDPNLDMHMKINLQFFCSQSH